ncbi:MerR family transcriptional regulator [Limimaricola soesokkakensis]|uniref:MerR family transcriptional regulator n=1 Tax=Limimaricola soesokkakensis TaxID=1343159 RepID=UPI0035155B74
MAKSAHAFRTIGEVSEALNTPAHVLRFWESKFAQVRPVKRAGGRRYYRPEDLDLLGGIKALLHDQGMTIKGVQKLLREKGVRHVADQGRDLVAEPEARSAPPRPNRPDSSQAEDAVLVLDPATDLAPLLQRRSAPPAPAETASCAPLALLHAAGPAFLETRAARIAPLVARLESLRGRMVAARDGKR